MATRKGPAAPPVPAAQAGGGPGHLAGRDELELLGIVGSLPRASQRRAEACELLVIRYRGLVRSCAQRYSNTPEPAEDLMQVGYVGLLKAINNFDPAAGSGLGPYAQATIIGEIKRYFRDKRWPLHVKRSVKELAGEVRTATGQLTQELGRAPAESELAGRLAVSAEDLREAQRAEMAFTPSSLDMPIGGQPGTVTLADVLGAEDPAIECMLSMRAVAGYWGELPAREQRILVMRFYGDMTQAQIGHQFGLSQMHVSRLQAHALGYLRLRVLGLPALPPQARARTARVRAPGAASRGRPVRGPARVPPQ
ncbi:MAG: sigma-70 family RNA polymerase sigma factor [Streptosporangiaceae bacterium]